jgi:hypothetical protein
MCDCDVDLCVCEYEEFEELDEPVNCADTRRYKDMLESTIMYARTLKSYLTFNMAECSIISTEEYNDLIDQLVTCQEKLCDINTSMHKRMYLLRDYYFNNRPDDLYLEMVNIAEYVNSEYEYVQQVMQPIMAKLYALYLLELSNNPNTQQILMDKLAEYRAHKMQLLKYAKRDNLPDDIANIEYRVARHNNVCKLLSRIVEYNNTLRTMKLDCESVKIELAKLYAKSRDIFQTADSTAATARNAAESQCVMPGKAVIVDDDMLGYDIHIMIDQLTDKIKYHEQRILDFLSEKPNMPEFIDSVACYIA